MSPSPLQFVKEIVNLKLSYALYRIEKQEAVDTKVQAKELVFAHIRIFKEFSTIIPIIC